MGKKVSPTTIGVFVIGAIVLIVVAISVWGSGRLFKTRYPFVCYFPGSVNGLSAGAPVKFRGVQVGQVTDIRLVYAQTQGAPRIPVFISIDADRVRGLGRADFNPSTVRELIENGLRARLQTLSIVTGVLFVDFDLEPDTTVDMVQPPDEWPPEIPTLPTPLEEATKTIGDVLAQLKEVDFKGIAAAARRAIDGVDRVVANPNLVAAIDELPDTVAAARGVLTKLNTQTGPITDGVRQVTVDARRTLERLRVTVDQIQGLIAPEAPLSIDVARTLADVGRAARAVQSLADFLERYPNSVVFGPPKP